MLSLQKFKLVFVAVALSSMLIAQTAQAAIVELVTNGSLTGSIANGVNTGNGLPSGWLNGVSGTTVASSPDTMDGTHNAGKSGIAGAGFGATPSASPNGGTWVGIGRNFGLVNENFYQTISGFEIGQQYTLSWYDANFGIKYQLPSGSAIDYTGSNQFKASLTNSGNVFSFIGSSRSLGQGWFFNSFVFTPTATEYTLNFGLANGTKSYLSIDGISIVSKVTAVPEPSTWLLLIMGLITTALVARRNKRVTI